MRCYIVLVFLFLATGLAGLAGCQKEVASEVQHEEANVLGLHFKPTYTEISYGPKLNFDGELVWGLVTTRHPDYWQVDLECQHGRFTVYGQKAKPLYERFRMGQKVHVYYREVFIVSEENGKETKAHKDFWFIEAHENPLPNEK